jgi:outer membrane protein OmpA-like peptidoglycan-associated protein
MRKQHLNIHLLLIWFSVSMIQAQSPINKAGWKTIKIANEKAVNSVGMESSPAFMGDKVGFVTAPAAEKKDGFKEPFYDLAWAQVQWDNSLNEVSEIHPRINSELHEGPMAYNAWTHTLYFTRSHKESRERKGELTDTSYLRILSADLTMSKPRIAPVNFNVDNYSVCHPTLTKDGKSMVFSSNRPGGSGGMDLYISYLEGDVWSDPVHLDTFVNTEYHEIFPYLWNDTLLFFASERPDGWGGLDIYVSVKDGEVWQSPELLASPINSPFDDLGMILRDNAMSGYFTSNRPGGQGKDDIYSFQSKEPVIGVSEREKYEARVEVVDKLTFDPVENSKIEISVIDVDVNDFILSAFNVDVLDGRNPGDIFLKLTPQNKKNAQITYTDSLGKTAFSIQKNKKYLISAVAEGYNSVHILYDYDLIGSEFNLVLEPSGKEQDMQTEPLEITSDDKEDSDIRDISLEKGSVIVFENIYYAYNSHQILEDAGSDLNILAHVMLDNPGIHIRIESHTDSRGTHAYNQQLSIRRAEAVRQYLIGKGIDEDRMTIKGYGESLLRNDCKDGVTCTEEQHKYNRRTEIVVE